MPLVAERGVQGREGSTPRHGHTGEGPPRDTGPVPPPSPSLGRLSRAVREGVASTAHGTVNGHRWGHRQHRRPQ